MEQSHEAKLASKGKRCAAAIVDFLLVPIVTGVGLGLLFVAAKTDQSIQKWIFIGLATVWLIIRDAIGSPGRAMVGIILRKTDGSAVGLGTAIGRNIHLMIPFVSLLGFLVEFIALLSTGHRLADQWAHTVVVEK